MEEIREAAQVFDKLTLKENPNHRKKCCIWHPCWEENCPFQQNQREQERRKREWGRQGWHSQSSSSNYWENKWHRR